MKYKKIKLPQGDVLVDEAEIKEGVFNKKYFNTYDNKIWIYRPAPCALPYWGNLKTLKNIVATINHSIDKDIPIVIIEDEVEKLAEESTAEVIQVNADFSLKEVYKEFFKEGYNARKQEGGVYSKEQLRFIYDTAIHSTTGGLNHDEVFKKVISFLSQEYIDLETESISTIPFSKFAPDRDRGYIERFKTTRDESGQLIAYKAQ